ncbi:MAG TPA: three-Cys-motif partner protein TcmP [Longimicrobium sp.]|nr:three-Cys-motif partner protein TcmP [Longimicrobium sp.]
MSGPGDRHFDEFHDHTKLKHLILRKYVGAWAAKLRNLRGEVWFVDAFAGEGQDKKGNPGSPLISAQLAEPFENDGQGVMRILAIEKDEARFTRLEEVMRPYTDRKIAYVRDGTLAERVDKFMGFIGDKPALFFLDPFGVEGLLVDLLPKLLRGPQNEVFALFADVGANRLHAVLMAEGKNPDQEEQAVRATPSLFSQFEEEDAQRARVAAEKSLRALRATQDASERILSEALGPSTLEELAAVPEHERREWLVHRYMRRLFESGARYVLALPVRDASSQRVYQLVYATKSAVGLRTMKEAMDSALRHTTLPDESKELILAELRGNEDAAVRELARYFAGREVRWTEDKDRKSDTVKRYLLEQTALFPMQFSKVQQCLAETGFVASKRPLTLRFPPIPEPQE